MWPCREGSGCNNMQATHTHRHILSFYQWHDQKNHISFAAVPKTNTISSSLSCSDLTMNVIDSSSALTQVWCFLEKTSMHIHLKKTPLTADAGGYICVVVPLNFNTAYDTINHVILLRLLKTNEPVSSASDQSELRNHPLLKSDLITD